MERVYAPQLSTVIRRETTALRSGHDAWRANSDDESPLVSVILPVRNGEPYLGVQLKALAAQSCRFPREMIVVDNGSTDSTVDTAR